MEKSQDAFRTISEVAQEINVPQHVLRFWETRFSQIKPMKRGGGRRYYRPLDVHLIKTIRHMLYDQGYTIKGVQKLLKKNRNPSSFLQQIPKMNDKPDTLLERKNEKEAIETMLCEINSFVDKEDSAGLGFDSSLEALNAFVSPLENDTAMNDHTAIHENRSIPFPETKKLSPEKRELLQKTLINLLECKRLLDQVRSIP